MSVAFVFPGQGSQRSGMGADIATTYPEAAQRYFERADDILGFHLSRMCFEGPDEDLVKTENQQPAIFVVSCAMAWVLGEHGIAPEAVAGHSLGEYSALVAAGALSFDDGVRLTRRRGELMAQVAARTGGIMAAVLGLAPERVEAICDEARDLGVAEVANYNSPLQTVISGEEIPVRQAMQLAADAGAKRVVQLPVSAPFHCSLMAPLAQQFAPALDGVTMTDPRVPVIANVNAGNEHTASEVRHNLIQQLDHAVRWTESMRALAGMRVDCVIEVGPGRVLTGLMRSIDASVRAMNTDDAAGIHRVIESVRSTSADSVSAQSYGQRL